MIRLCLIYLTLYEYKVSTWDALWVCVSNNPFCFSISTSFPIDHAFQTSFLGRLLFWLLFSLIKCMCVWEKVRGMAAVPSTTKLLGETPNFPRMRGIFQLLERRSPIPRETPLGMWFPLWSSLSSRPLCSSCYPWGTATTTPQPFWEGAAEEWAMKSVILFIYWR